MPDLFAWYQGSPLSTATWVDWVDIAVLSWVIYQVLMFLRGTRALQSIVGLAVLGVGYVLSDIWGLTAVHWVLDNMVVWVVLAVIILFQEDIRRALARAGRHLLGAHLGRERRGHARRGHQGLLRAGQAQDRGPHRHRAHGLPCDPSSRAATAWTPW